MAALGLGAEGQGMTVLICQVTDACQTPGYRLAPYVDHAISEGKAIGIPVEIWEPRNRGHRSHQMPEILPTEQRTA